MSDLKPYIWYGFRGPRRASGTAQLTLEDVVTFIQKAAEEEWDTWTLFTSQDGNPAVMVARISLEAANQVAEE